MKETLVDRIKKIRIERDISGDVFSRLARMNTVVFSRTINGFIPIDATRRTRLEEAIEVIEALSASVAPVPVHYRCWRLLAPLVGEFQAKSPRRNAVRGRPRRTAAEPKRRRAAA